MPPRVLALSAAFALVWSSGAGAQERPAADPVLGERLIEAVATTDRLWVLNQDGAVVAFDRATGDRQVLAESGVSDLLRVDGRTVALRADPDAPAKLQVVDLADGRSLTPGMEATDGSLLKVGREWIIIGPEAVFRSDGGPWVRRPIRDDARHFGVVTAAAAGDGAFYVGYNQGEWGGGLWRIAPGADVLHEISRIDGDGICDGPLNTACDPVTGVIPDPSAPECVLASTGLSHFLLKGSILRVCGESVELVFEEVIPQPADSLGAGMNKWPMFGLAAIPEGWVAVSAGRLFVSRGGSVSSIEFPEIAEWSGLGLAEMDGFLILRTDVNWGMSLSGYTPLLTPVSE